MLPRRNFFIKSTKYVALWATFGKVDEYLTWATTNAQEDDSKGIQIVAEEDIYTYVNADNGASPLWASGCTTIVRIGGRVFASGLETDPEIDGLSNCKWLLYERKKSGWILVARDQIHYNREPCPLGVFKDDQILLSVNPKMADGCTRYCPTFPKILTFKPEAPYQVNSHWIPEWGYNPGFNDHSYRAWGIDGTNKELVLFQNYMYDHAQWCFRDSTGAWSANGAIYWPKGHYNDEKIPLRLCYSNTVLRNRQVWFLSTSDIVEPVEAWRNYKLELTGRKWDYVFRRLYFAFCPNIKESDFSRWVLIADRDNTAGQVRNQDLWVDEEGTAYLLWSERKIDERLRSAFFPNVKQYKALNCSVVSNGKLISTHPVEDYRENVDEDLTPGNGRFHLTPDGRLFVIYYVSGTSESGHAVSENRITEIRRTPHLSIGASIKIPFTLPFLSFQTPSQRSGCKPSYHIDLLGQKEGKENIISYSQITIS